jgi:integrase
MSNSKLYNENIKLEFLQMYPKESRPVYSRIFAKCAINEFKFKKDLYDFDMELIEDVLTDLDPLTAPISRTNGRIISSYLNWAIHKGYKKNPINILKAVDPNYFDKFVSKKKIYFSYDEIRQIERFCENAQDAVLIRLLFESVNGKESSEIRNLKDDDGMIDRENRTLHLVDDDGSKRSIQVSEVCMVLIERALNETTYLKSNGMMEERENVRPYTDLMKNNYVVRNSITRSDNYNGPVNQYVVYRRISAIGELFTIPYFTSKNILRSGIIYMGYQILKNKKEKELTKEDYMKIAERYKIGSWYSIREYCNVEMIESLYGEE